jgi:hypothetical protein
MRTYYRRGYTETQRIGDNDLKKLREWFWTCLTGGG